MSALTQEMIDELTGMGMPMLKSRRPDLRDVAEWLSKKHGKRISCEASGHGRWRAAACWFRTDDPKEQQIKTKLYEAPDLALWALAVKLEKR